MTNYTNSDDELKTFKTADIRGLLPLMGWHVVSQAEAARVDKHRTKPGYCFTNGSQFMNVSLSNQGDGTWMWFSVTGYICGKAHGTIIDIAKDHVGGNFGKARVFLREALSISRPSTPVPSAAATNTTPLQNPSAVVCSTRPLPAPVEIDEKKTPDQLEAEYRALSTSIKAGKAKHSLFTTRGIDLVDDTFSYAMREMNNHSGYVFPYYNFNEGSNGISFAGYEIKKENGFKQYAKGGRAGFWIGGDVETSTVIVCESPLDAMAHSIITQSGALYVAVRSGSEADVVRFIAHKFKRGYAGHVRLACDHDAAGYGYVNKIWSGIDRLGLKAEGIVVTQENPLNGENDHCDVLKKIVNIRDDENGKAARNYMRTRIAELQEDARRIEMPFRETVTFQQASAELAM
jgi:hypothetical protein